MNGNEQWHTVTYRNEQNACHCGLVSGQCYVWFRLSCSLRRSSLTTTVTTAWTLSTAPAVNTPRLWRCRRKSLRHWPSSGKWHNCRLFLPKLDLSHHCLYRGRLDLLMILSTSQVICMYLYANVIHVNAALPGVSLVIIVAWSILIGSFESYCLTNVMFWLGAANELSIKWCFQLVLEQLQTES